MKNFNAWIDKEMTYMDEADAYRVLVRKLNHLLHHAGNERKVNVTGIKRALAQARAIAHREINP